MNNLSFNLENKKFFWIFTILIIGCSLRVFASMQGFMTDTEYWRFNADLIKYNGDLYGTGNNPYGPIWIHILFYLDKIPFFVEGELESLRYKVMIFLTFVDIIVFFVVFNLHSLKVGILFFLNPVSIFITGFHGQFGILAVLLGFLAVIVYEKSKNNTGFFLCIFLLGASLVTKHILFLFPFWLAIKEEKWSKKILFCTIPYLIFILSFIPFESSLSVILIDTFGYQSYDNGIFWRLFIPQPFITYIGFQNLFFISLIIMGFVIEKENKIKSFYLYLVSLVLFASATTNQYLAIPIIALAFFWNRFYLLYTIACCLFFLVNHDALNIEYIQEIAHWTRHKTRIGYKIIIICLALGFLQTLIGKGKFDSILRQILIYITTKIKNQFSIK